MEVLAAVGCEIDEFGCAADMDKQGPGKGREISGRLPWLVSYRTLALTTGAWTKAGVLRHNRGVERLDTTYYINPQPPSHCFQPSDPWHHKSQTAAGL